MVLALAVAVGASAAGETKKVALKQKGTPIESVITMLEKLEAQTKEEGKKEAASYDKFACFCKEQADEKFYLINKAKKKIKLLESEIETLDGEIEELEAETAKAKEEKKGLDEEIEADKKARQEALEAFMKADGEKAELIDALDRAIKALEEAKAKQVNAKTMLAQEYTTPILTHLLTAGGETRYNLSEEQTKAVFAFLEGQQQPAAYEYKSND